MVFSRYHSTSILRSALRYRIGKLATPWKNKLPAIRGGVFQNPNKTKVDTEPSQNYAVDCRAGETPELTFAQAAAKKEADQHANPTAPVGQRLRKDTVTRDFIDKAVESGVDSDLADYPSVDPQTQKLIEAKYKALHKLVHDGGFYQCRYGEYAKEVVRYLALFSLCMLALHHRWYLSSAVLLGLFWVSQEHCLALSQILTLV